MACDWMKRMEQSRTISSAWNEGYLATLLLLPEFQSHFRAGVRKGLKRTSKSKQKLDCVCEVCQEPTDWTTDLAGSFPEEERGLAPGKRSQQTHMSTLTCK